MVNNSTTLHKNNNSYYLTENIKCSVHTDSSYDSSIKSYVSSKYTDTNKKNIIHNKRVNLNIKSKIDNKQALAVKKVGKIFRLMWKSDNKFYISEYDEDGNEIKNIGEELDIHELRMQEKIFNKQFLPNIIPAKLTKDIYGKYSVQYNGDVINLVTRSNVNDLKCLEAIKINKKFRIIWKKDDKFYFNEYDQNGNEIKMIDKEMGPKLLKKHKTLFKLDLNGNNVTETTTTKNEEKITEFTTMKKQEQIEENISKNAKKISKIKKNTGKLVSKFSSLESGMKRSISDSLISSCIYVSGSINKEYNGRYVKQDTLKNGYVFYMKGYRTKTRRYIYSIISSSHNNSRIWVFTKKLKLNEYDGYFVTGNGSTPVESFKLLSDIFFKKHKKDDFIKSSNCLVEHKTLQDDIEKSIRLASLNDLEIDELKISTGGGGATSLDELSDVSVSLNKITFGDTNTTAILPASNNGADLGSSSYQFKNLYIDSVAYLDAIGFGDTAMTLPTADGGENQVLKTDGSGTLSWDTVTAESGGDVTAASNFVADNRIIRSNGTGKGVQHTGITIDDSNNVSGMGTLGCGAITVQTGIVPDAQDEAYLGTSSLQFSDLFLADAAVISFGDTNEIKLTHIRDQGLTLKHEAGGNVKPIVLTLATGETDISTNDVIGRLNFQAPNEGTGGDANKVCAGIEAVSEGNFANDNNATKLSFKTAASDDATEKMSLSSGGNLNVSGTVGCGAITSTHSANATTLSVTNNTITTGSLVNITSSSISTGDALKIDLTQGTLSGGKYINCYDDTGSISVFTVGEDGVTTITSSETSASDAGAKLILRCNDGGTMPDGHRLGVIEFHGAVNDSNTVGSGPYIEAIATGTWSSSVQDSSLKFYTASGTSQPEVLELDKDKLATFSGNVKISGTTPKLTIGDAGAEDTMLVFDGNAQDFRIGLDDGTDKLEIGVGSSHGTTTAITIDSSQVITCIGNLDASAGLDVTGSITCSVDLNIEGNIDMATGQKITWVNDNTYISGTDTGITIETDDTLTLNADTSVTMDAPSVVFTSSTTDKPLFEIVNETNDSTGPHLRLANKRGFNSGANSDVAGTIDFFTNDAGGNNQAFGEIKVEATAVAGGSEQGTMTIGVACTDDGGIDTILTISGGANAAGSTTNVSGSILHRKKITTITGTSNTDSSGTASGTTYIFNNTGDITFTLPDSGSGTMIGVYYNFIIGETPSGGVLHKVICTDTTNEVIYGAVTMVESGVPDAISIYSTGSSTSVISSNGTTTGIQGSRYTLTCIGTDKWQLSDATIIFNAGADPATPFSDP